MKSARPSSIPPHIALLVVSMIAVASFLLPLPVSADSPPNALPATRDPGPPQGIGPQSLSVPATRSPGPALAPGAPTPSDIGAERSLTYNRGAAVAYADQWAHGRNPAYVDYTANDCTNFISQSMHAGGIPMIYGDQNRYNAFNWFYTPSYNSNTWSAADWINQFFFNHQDTYFQFVQDSSLLSSGDVFIAQRPDSQTHVPDHGGFIVGYGPSSGDGADNPPGTYGLLRDQHSNDRLHVIWDDAFDPGTSFWFWHIVY